MVKRCQRAQTGGERRRHLLADPSAAHLIGTGPTMELLHKEEAITAEHETHPTSSVVDSSSCPAGTGLSASGAAGSYLRSNGTQWVSSPIHAGDIPNGYVNLKTNQIVAGHKSFSQCLSVETTNCGGALTVASANLSTATLVGSAAGGTWLTLRNTSSGGNGT